MHKLSILLLASLCAAGLGVAAMGEAHAEDCGTDDGAGSGAADAKQGKFHIEYVNGKPITVIDTVVAVCGKVPRPSVVYVLKVRDIAYEWESLKQDFMPLILATVKKAPF